MKAPKNLTNKFGGYQYRNAEGILEAFKPYEKELNVALVVADEIVNIGERYYVKATATFFDIESGESISNTAYARESENKKGMDESQITGATSSYARKYALNGLFLLDDTKDADTDEYKIVSDKKSKIEDNNVPQDLPPEIQVELTENASEFEIDNFKEACAKAGFDYKEIWKQTGKASDMSKAHLGKAMLQLKDMTNARA